MKLSKHVKVK